MHGMKQTFLFMPIREEVTLQRKYACWCPACLQAWAPGEGSMDTLYRCKDCVSTNLIWKETAIGRTDAAGISNQRKRSQNKARELTKQLQSHFARSNQPVWVAVQNRGEDNSDQFWIGRALRIIHTYTESGSAVGTGGRVRYDAGDVEIAVEWFERDLCGGDERRIFKIWVADEETEDVGPIAGEKYSFNSTELRLLYNPSAGPGAIQLEMQPLELIGGAPLNVVQHLAVRGSTRLASVPRPNYTCRNVSYHVCQQRADPPNQLWELSAGSERVI